MKTDNQPKRTQGGESKIEPLGKLFQGTQNPKKIYVDKIGCIAEMQYAEDAQRIVKCCNNEWKIDMHDELVELVDIMDKDYNALSAQRRLNEHGTKLHEKIKRILKQAEGKQ